MTSGLPQTMDTQALAERMTFTFENTYIERHVGTTSAGDSYGPVEELSNGQRQADMQQALRNYLKKGYCLDDIAREVKKNSLNPDATK